MEPDEAVREVSELIATHVAGGDTIEGALRRLGRWIPEDLREAGRDLYERRAGLIRELKDPGALVDKELLHGYWYPGPKMTDVFWPKLESRLVTAIDSEGLEGVRRGSDRILDLMRPPGSPNIDTRGLVLGYVQSGKTTSFMSVIAKAADVGYRLFVVMSGITENLRAQTQERLEGSLVADLDDKWFLLTDKDADFHRTDNARNLLGRTDHRLLAVVKKNPYRLKRLVDWIQSAGELTLQACPILIIDDEADQASIDVGNAGRTSRINGLIRQLLGTPKAAYVAYTATPFANLLVNPQDYDGLYARDFIVSLPRSSEYFGPERVFGRDPLTPEEEGTAVTEGMDVVRHVDPVEIPLVQPPKGKGAVYSWQPEVSSSLEEALRWFFLATAARRARNSGIANHSTMLVHTSMLSVAHMKLATALRDRVAYISEQLKDDSSILWGELQGLWEAESLRVAPEGAPQQSWDEIRDGLRGVVDGASVIVDNYLSVERLSYTGGSPVTAIVIGGNTLSRGLTLEGLIASYFVRSASAYDTLLQMGRWFGYRKGYADLTRVWMPGDLEAWFFDLATVEEEIRMFIRRYEDEDLKPSQLAVKIRNHPAMTITSAAKMRSAVKAEISFGRTRQQTILFEHRDEGWLERNQDAVRNLVANHVSLGGVVRPNRSGRAVLRDVSSAQILSFVEEYNFHPRAQQLRTDLLTGYIRSQNAQGFLHRWNIVMMSHPDKANGTVQLGLSEPVNLIQRSRMDIPSLGYANIKSLVSMIDRVADLDYSLPELQAMAASTGDQLSDAVLLRLREELVGDVGLLNVYPISKDSAPQGPVRRDGERLRLALEAKSHVIGLGLFFPGARGAKAGVSYLSADLSAEEVEAVEDFSAMDLADEERGAEEDKAEAAKGATP